MTDTGDKEGLLQTLFRQAVANLQSGRLSEARSMCEQILQRHEQHSDALHLAGLIASQQGDRAAATDLIRKAIVARPNEPLFYGNLARLLMQQGRLGESIACFEKELAHKPDWPDTLINLGAALRAQGRLAEAVQRYLRAIELQPSLATAHSNLGNVYLAMGEFNQAGVCYQRAIQLESNYAEAWVNLGRLNDKLGQLSEAERCLRRAITINPGLMIAHSNLGKLLLEQGRLEDALFEYGQCEPANDKKSLLVKYALHLPAIMGTKAEVHAVRAQFEKNLDHIMGRVQIDDPIKEGCHSNFYLAFHGLNNRDIQKKVARFYGDACPSLLYTAPHCLKSGNKASRRRIGFFSKFIYRHSVSMSFAKVVDVLSQNAAFELLLISTQVAQDVNSRHVFADFRGRHVHLSDNLASARAQIAELELDILVYLDIGMEPFGYFLSFARLAPVQCVMGGHPDTTGVGNVDYWLSTDLAECEDAQLHYSEQLVRLPFGSCYFASPRIKLSQKGRGDFGLPMQGALYVCPMLLQKIHPEFDDVIERILESDQSGQVIFFEDKSIVEWRGLLQRRFHTTLSSTANQRVHFLPWVDDADDFGRLIELSSVVLDPLHFGIGTTGIITCSVGTPFVTLPSAYLRGRVGLLYCQLLDIMDCVATDIADYVAKAVTIANSPQLRLEISARMLKNRGALLDNDRGIRDVSAFLTEVPLVSVSPSP
jgi:protein O-GlcNAc transferase